MMYQHSLCRDPTVSFLRSELVPQKTGTSDPLQGGEGERNEREQKKEIGFALKQKKENI